MVVALKSLKLAYMPLPKAACTSVKAGLALIDPDIDTDIDTIRANPDIVHGYYQTTRFRPQRWEMYSDFWRFAIVRDPLKRLISAYTDRVVKRRELHNSRKLKLPNAPLPRDPDPDFFFQNLAAYKQAASSVKHHVMPAHLFVGPKPRNYDGIYKIEQLEQLSRDIATQTGQPFVIPRFNKSPVGLTFEDLQPTTRDCIRDYLSEEYDQLDEFYSRPW